jgi:hypothetical protein
MFYGWLRSGGTSRQQAENALSSGSVSLDIFHESNAVTEKKARTLMFSRTGERWQFFPCFIQHSMGEYQNA